MEQNVQRNKDYCDRLWHVWAQQFGREVPVENLSKKQKKQITLAVDKEFSFNEHQGRAIRSRLKRHYDCHYTKLVAPFMNEPFQRAQSNPVETPEAMGATT